ncbi:hypothetical protein WJX74_011059 [Apatococcus lobatus]|uniref:Purine permease n=1 Tax=Apatococcus lobatus TaxID=904363 RepID=A0AAW1QMY0_9CHLO
MKADLEEGADVAEHPQGGHSEIPKKERKLLGVHLERWIPLGSWKDALIGDYDYTFLFMPKWRYCRNHKVERLPPFFAVNEPLPLLLALILGFQHAAAMVGGIVLGPILVTASNTDPDAQAVMACPCRSGAYCLSPGITTTQIVVGVKIIQNYQAAGHTWNEAYGTFLGTVMVCSFVTTILSFFPISFLRRIFRPWIAGTTVFLMGVTLIGAGLENWGGGDACADGTSLCKGNGSVQLPYGSPQYLGLGAVCFLAFFLIETFGSPFMRNAEIILALFIGYAVAAFVRADYKWYVATTEISNAVGGTFLWVHAFPLGIIAEGILPFIIGYLADAATAIGDLTATEEASGLPNEGPEYDRRIQGCLLADGINSCLAALGTPMPINVFAQNTGIISFSMCASRVAGIFAGTLLFLFGIIGSISTFFAYVPNCVYGGITTFLFGSIAVWGIKVMTQDGIDRRTRFIMAVAVCEGIGVTISPKWATNNLWNVSETAPSGVRAIRNSRVLVLSTGYVFGWVMAVVLGILLPYEPDDTVQRNKAAAAAAHQKFLAPQHAMDSKMRDQDPHDLQPSPKLQELHADHTA